MTFPEPTYALDAQTDEVIGTLTVLGEARGESDLGKCAIAHVILNRARRSGRSVADTCLAPWQFSCWNAADPNRLFLEETIHKAAKNIPLGLWAACWSAFVEARDHKTPDPTNGATHYCVSILWGRDDSGKRRPAWHSRQEVEAGRTKELARIGSHVFAEAA